MSASPQLIENALGIALQGELTFESVPAIWMQIQKVFLSRNHVEIDFKGVSYSNSAGLALLTACIRDSQRLKVPVVFKNLPKQMNQIAKVTGINLILQSV